MRIIRNNVLPFKGFSCINLFGVLFIRKNTIVSDRMLNHESIHTAQMKENFYVFFYLWYVTEWLIRLIQMRNAHKIRLITYHRKRVNVMLTLFSFAYFLSSKILFQKIVYEFPACLSPSGG